MSKPGDENWLPRKEYLATIPKKRVSSGAVFVNTAGEVLVVKPSYKDYWIIPGGSIEQYESPTDGCRREIREELGLEIDSLVFVGMLHIPRPEENDDILHCFYYGGILNEQQQSSIVLQKEELLEFRFVQFDQLRGLTKPELANLLPKLVKAGQEGEVV